MTETETPSFNSISDKTFYQKQHGVSDIFLQNEHLSQKDFTSELQPIGHTCRGIAPQEMTDIGHSQDKTERVSETIQLQLNNTLILYTQTLKIKLTKRKERKKEEKQEKREKYLQHNKSLIYNTYTMYCYI